MTADSARTDLELGRLLRLIRLAAGMSQSDLAKAAGVSFQQIQKYELGQNRVSVSRLLALATALGERPAIILTMLEERLMPPRSDRTAPDTPRLEFLASPRGRIAVSALAACVNDRLIDAVTELLVASSGDTQDAVPVAVPRSPLVFEGKDGAD